MVKVQNKVSNQGTVVHKNAKQSEPPGTEVKINKEGNTSGVRGIELPPHVRDFRILRNGKLIYTDIDPDRPRTTASLRSVGEEITSTSISEDIFESQPIPVSSQVENSSRSTTTSFPDNARPCEVILTDVFASDETAKLKLLNFNPDKNHSVHSQPSEEKILLENISPKLPIAWPKSNDSEAWENLDSAVYSRLLSTKVPLEERVALLESTIYDQATILFGVCSPPKTKLDGLSRRARYSISLVKSKSSSRKN